jgi:hypothetical protein
VVVLNEGDLTSDEALKEKLAKEQGIRMIENVDSYYVIFMYSCTYQVIFFF